MSPDARPPQTQTRVAAGADLGGEKKKKVDCNVRTPGVGGGDEADMFNGCARARSDITIAENLNFLSLARVIPIRAKEG